MSDEQMWTDGWYKIDDEESCIVAWCHNTDHGAVCGDDYVSWLIEQGYTFTLVHVLTPAEHDDLRAQIATLTAQVAELGAWKRTATRDLKVCIEANHNQQRVIVNERERADALRVQLAERGEWEDVPPGEYADGYFKVNEDNTITIFSNNGSNWIILEAPDGMKLRRRVAAAERGDE